MVFKSGYDPFPDKLRPQFPDFKIKNITGAISLPSAASKITRNPLCNKNILKGVDGIASLPDAAESLGKSLGEVASDLSLFDEDGNKKIPAPSFEDMFSGLPEITELANPEFILESLGLPTEIDPEQVVTAAADDVLRQLDIDNSLAELCKEVDQAAQDAQQTLLTQTPTLPNINSLIPTTELPSFGAITDRIPRAEDLI